MPTLIVTNTPSEWPFHIPDVEVVSASAYLTRPEFSELRGAKVFNLCRSYRYQSSGYYVSLLAEARGHKPLPNITSIQDLKSQAMVRLVSEELEESIQKSLTGLQSDAFTLSIYFGRNLARKYERLSMQLFNLFQSPLLRVQFARDKEQVWEIRSVSTISMNEVPDAHREFLVQAASDHFSGRTKSVKKRTQFRYDLAILHNPAEAAPPSDEKALRRFTKAFESLGIAVEQITRDDYGRLAEFDALFIRETTAVNHHTYRFARRAASEGLVVIDDPQSIVRCTNKVFLAELLNRHELPTPKTVVVHKHNIESLVAEIGFPCVLKKPDSAFSQGVIKVDSEAELQERLKELFAQSDLLVAQEFLPTTFDWRIGIVDRRPLYACKYFMAPKHWQIIKHEQDGSRDYGKFETLPIELAPRKAVAAALKAANYIGDGLYGVDVKQSGDKFYIIEVNDNPNLDAGVEDAILRDELYRRIAGVFLARIERRKAGMAIA